MNTDEQRLGEGAETEPSPMRAPYARVMKKEVCGETLGESVEDQLAVEEPLEIVLEYSKGEQRVRKNIAITMRTPGNDTELATGFLFTEGIISGHNDISAVTEASNELGNSVTVALKPEVAFDAKQLERHFYTHSSCGVCGKASLEALKITGCSELKTDAWQVPLSVIHSLPEKLRAQQAVFEMTGGLHAAALFDSAGNLQLHREDVGRHNAVDKLIGTRLAEGLNSFTQSIVLVSGRTSYEILQKLLQAQCPIIVAVGAPSTLAVELANTFNVTLIGFARNNRFNIYSAPQRIA